MAGLPAQERAVIVNDMKILFVHGTGVRGASFDRSLALVSAKVRQYLPRYEVAGCNWGDAFGARLNAKGGSIPGYGSDGNPGDAARALEAASMARWTLLSDDPLLELRVTDLAPPLGPPQGPMVWRLLEDAAEAPAAVALLSTWGLAPLWPDFIGELVADEAWARTVQRLGGTRAQLAAPVSRAVVAAFLGWLRLAGEPGITGPQRDELVLALQPSLGGAALGLRDWLADKLTGFALPRRTALSDRTGAALGDILRYQARGETLRNFIGDRAGKTGATVILAHSLGGVAAVDWLASGARNVGALVTVGSQAPYFYEIDALVSRAYGDGLPAFFPRRWLNFYDPRDFLSFAGRELFPDIARDVVVDNGQPFPESHGAYWHNDHEVWPEIARFLP